MRSRNWMHLVLLIALLPMVAAAGEGSWQRFREVRPALGSTFEILAYAPDERSAGEAFGAAFARVEEISGIFSVFDSESEVLRLVRQAPMSAPVAISPELAQVLEYSLGLSQQTEGAFDVTVGPLTRLWRRTRRLRELPSAPRLAEARAAVGAHLVELDPEQQTLRLLGENMRLDFGAVAKGYATDEALQVLREHGLSRVLINAGGDLMLGEPPPGAAGWRVGVAALRPGDPPRQILELAQCAVATSGDAWQFVEIEGQRYSHVIDPRSGFPISQRIGVTVVAPGGMMADALASAVMVLGPEQGIALVDQIPEAACWVITVQDDQPRTFRSQKFPSAADGSFEP